MESSRKKIAVGVLLALVAAVSASALVSRENSDPSPGAGEVAIVERAGPGGTDLTITEEELDASLKDLAKEEGLPAVPPEDDPDYESLRMAAIEQLLFRTWLLAEARERGVEVGKKEIEREREEIIRQGFSGSEREFRRFLVSSGTTERKLRADAEERLLAAAIQEDAVPSQATPPKQEIERYYQQNQDQFKQPATRDVYVLLTEDKRDARKVLNLLKQDDSARSWRRVAARFSLDGGTGGSGELHRDVAPGEAGEAVDAAMYTAAVDELTGPIKSEDGFYVIQVRRVTPARVAPLAESRDQIRQAINQQAVSVSRAALFEKWSARSFCAEDFSTDRCADG